MQATVGTRPVARRRSWIERKLLTPRAARITAPLVFLVAWQVIAPMTGSGILPMPTDVVEAMWEQLRDGSLVEAFSVSLLRLAIGFALALVAGSVVGLAMGMSPRIEAMFHDFVVVGLTFPYLIWGLLVAIWFGFGPIGPVLVVFIAGLPYVILNASEGVRDVSKELRDMATAYEVPRNRILRHLIVPSLSPFFFASLRYGLANGWKGLVLAEVFAATSGAGYHINEMREYGNFAGVVGFAVYFAIFSIIVERLVFGRLSRRVFRWRPQIAREVSETPEVTAP
ncbi:MAG TPA: ABC transporter permease [Actinomycetota bacterium]|nr:ABC transporter permease [Actinomycetota bacterium]